MKLKLKREWENASLVKELGFLRNQFNSHITFNFLNYCYSKSHKKSTETAEAIETFSRMLRYSLSKKANEKVALKSELEYVKDFIYLQKLLNRQMDIRVFIHEEEGEGAYIFHRILIVFLETVFRRNNLYSDRLTISLHCSPNCVELVISIEKGGQGVVQSPDSNYEKSRQQLELFYKDKYILSFNEQDRSYSHKLKLVI